MKTKKKVLIIAGGGFFGLIPVTFLSYLPQQPHLLNNVDVLAGTSIGGIICSVLASGVNPLDMQKAFVDGGEKIFQKRWQSKINPLACPIYDNKNLSNFIEVFVGTKKIKDIKSVFPNLDFLVPALNMTKNQLKVFDNIDEKDGEISLLEVSLSTSAAPTYFPPRNYKGETITDGGVRENIPIITTATGLRNKKKYEFSDMDVFVICTGQMIRKNLSYKEVSSWNLLQWGLNFIIPDVTNSNESTSKFWGEHLGFNRFTIYNPVQIQGEMDDISKTTYMLEECEMFKEDFLEKWDEFIS